MSPSQTKKTEDESHSSISETHLRLWLKMLKASRLIENELRERLRLEFKTTLPQFDVMAALYRADQGLKMSKLSGELKVSNGNVTGIVDRLVKDDLVERVPVATDRRAMIVRLTQKGKASFAVMAEAHEAWVSELMTSVSTTEAEQLMNTLGAIEHSLDKKE
jgi:DNA-binding MarR family transcriptional regulator